MSEVDELKQEIKGLEQEVQKREEMIAGLQERLVKKVGPEDVATYLDSQHVDSLRYHLSRERKRSQRLKDKLEQANRELDEKEREINDLKIKLREQEQGKTGSPEKTEEGGQPGIQKKGQDFDMGEIVSEEEIDEVLSMRESRKKKHKGISGTARKYIKFLAKHKKIKIPDAALLLKADRRKLAKITKKLRKKKLVKGGEDMKDPVKATRKLMEYARRL